MSRIALDLDALSVESFETAAPMEASVAASFKTAHCSAIDACPSRLCDTRLCWVDAD